MTSRRKPFDTTNDPYYGNSKKNDEVLEDHMNKCKHSILITLSETVERLSALSKSVGVIKKVSMDIKHIMVDDEALVSDVDKGIVKNQNLLKQTMGRIDKLLTSASGNVLCYTILFFFMIVALLYKLTR